MDLIKIGKFIAELRKEQGLFYYCGFYAGACVEGIANRNGCGTFTCDGAWLEK